MKRLLNDSANLLRRPVESKLFSGHGDIKTLETFYFQPSASKLAHLIAKAKAEGGRVAA